MGLRLEKCIILANGRAPKKSVINYLLKRNYSTIICADGGANSAMKLGIVPDYIIGDLDSVHKSTLDYFKASSKIIRIHRQNDTDVEKCLKYVVKNGAADAILLGVTGDRLDHTFCNLGIVLKFFDKIQIKIIAENSILGAFKGNVILKTVSGETISLYGIDLKTKITSKGLKYPLKNIALPFGIKESTSNVALFEDVKLKITGGTIFIIRDFNTVKKYGLI